MRTKIEICSEKRITLPLQYNYIIQAVILKWLGDETYSKFIHDTGYEFNNRKYKMYTFSRLEGRFNIDMSNKKITFLENPKLIISSEDDKFLSYLINNIISKESFGVGGNDVYIGEVECSNYEVKGPINIFTKSPVAIYSTLINCEGLKKTYYYSPFEKEFSELARKNLIHKYMAINERKPEDDRFILEPIKNGKLKESVILYKGTIIKGWRGEFSMKGSDELINIAYNTGLGSKNSQGFGCIEIK